MLRSTSVMCIPARASLLTAAIPPNPMPTTTTRGAVPPGRRAARLNHAIANTLATPPRPWPSLPGQSRCNRTVRDLRFRPLGTARQLQRFPTDLRADGMLHGCVLRRRDQVIRIGFGQAPVPCGAVAGRRAATPFSDGVKLPIDTHAGKSYVTRG
jgi:hypothetical protein